MGGVIGVHSPLRLLGSADEGLFCGPAPADQTAKQSACRRLSERLDSRRTARSLTLMNIPSLQLIVGTGLLALASPSRAAGPAEVTHTFLATGADTRIVAADGSVLWKYPKSTRDGWVLPNGNVLLAVSKDKEYPGGAAVELTREGKLVFEWRGTQAEVNTVQALPEDRFLVSEAGPKPRLLELDRAGRTRLEIPLTCQNTNHHMESRMARKLPNGHYLVPQLLDKVVREYDAAGRIVWEVPTPNWAFTAIRLPNGHTLLNCTYGNLSIEVDGAGKTVWELSNSDLPEPLIKDACGGQRLPNGNTVICAYGVGAKHTKLLEVTPDKKVVWTYTDPAPAGIHEVQILDTNGKPIDGPPLR